MKRIISLALFAAMMSMPISAQSYHSSRYYNPNSGRLDYSRGSHSFGINAGETYYGFRIGPSFSTLHSDNEDLKGNKSQTGLTIGVVTGISLANSVPIFFETGLMYTEKGGKKKKEDTRLLYNLNYLEIPLVVKYVCEFDNSFSVQPFFGGYLSCGVGGKVKDYIEKVSHSSFSRQYYRRFDGGLRLGCGAGFGIVYLDLAYDIGLANISHDAFVPAHNGCFYIDFGVNF